MKTIDIDKRNAETPMLRGLADVSAVIVVSDRDFGACPLATRLPRAIWPLIDRPVLQHIVEGLAVQGVHRMIVCCGPDHRDLLSVIQCPTSVEISRLDQSFPRGTAGCLFDASRQTPESFFLLCPSDLMVLPDLTGLVSTHNQISADLTLLVHPNESSEMVGSRLSPICLCNRSVLEAVPVEGYCDLNEGILPDLLRKGMTIQSFPVRHSLGTFHTWRQYLEAISQYLNAFQDNAEGNGLTQIRTSIWTGNDVSIHPSARIEGSVIVGDRVNVSENAILIGPSVLGPDSHVGPSSVLSASVCWDGVSIGANARILNSLLTHHVSVPPNTTMEEQLCIRSSSPRIHPKPTVHLVDTIRDTIGYVPILSKIRENSDGLGLLSWITAAALIVAFLWSFWTPTLTGLWDTWMKNDEYSSGILVPIIAVYVLWQRRDDLRRVHCLPSLGWGIIAFALAQTMRIFSLYYGMISTENLCMVATIWSMVFLLFGWRLVWSLKAVLLFLLLMLPFPNQIQTAITLPLQQWSTSSAVFSLETLGYAVHHEGNVIDINGTFVAVAEACNGLRMITAFFVITGLVALVVRRSWLEKLILLASSVPIALLCNTVRLTVTAIAFTMIDATYWEKAFHDFGGLAMMPLALVFVVIELWFLSHVFLSPGVPNPEQIVYRK